MGHSEDGIFFFYVFQRFDRTVVHGHVYGSVRQVCPCPGIDIFPAGSVIDAPERKLHQIRVGKGLPQRLQLRQLPYPAQLFVELVVIRRFRPFLQLIRQIQL